MIQLTPCPKQWEILDENTHALSPAIHTAVAEWERYVNMFVELFLRAHAHALTAGDTGGIELVRNTALAKGAYTADSTSGALVLGAADDEGILYALSSALQLVRATPEGLCMQTLRVSDYPDKDYRATMIDLSRCWHPFDKLIKYVDLCFLYKVKYLHLHFIDDVYYTLPSRAFPLLPSEGKHYTFEQIEQLRAYAADRGVVLVPEIECPGHALSLNRAYPECFANRLDGEVEEFRNESGVLYDTNALLCAGSERAFEGLKALISEVLELFPESPYINIGGDEANIDLWNNCPDCRAYMKEHGIADVKELYSDYIGRACAFVLSLGRTPIVWEGFPEKGSERVPKQTIVIAWESHYHLAPDLLAKGFRIINATWQPLYIVDSLSRRWTPKDIWDWNVYNWQHWWPKSAATEHPINVEPTEQVLGAMLCAWCTTFEMEISRMVENLIAMSERSWAVETRRTFDDYKNAYHALLPVVRNVIQDM